LDQIVPGGREKGKKKHSSPCSLSKSWRREGGTELRFGNSKEGFLMQNHLEFKRKLNDRHRVPKWKKKGTSEGGNGLEGHSLKRKAIYARVTRNVKM